MKIRLTSLRYGIMMLFLVTAAVAVRSEVGGGAGPEAPRALVDTTYVQPGGKTIAVRPGGDLQAALDAAQPGDVIDLQAGATWRGSFRLPNKAAGSGWITVRSSAHASLPPPGTRVSPEQARSMARLVAPSTDYAVWTEAGAHHYRFVGIEITGESLPSRAANNGLIALDGGHYSGLTFVQQVRSEQVPHHIIFDRCYVHAGPDGGGEFVRGFIWNSASTALADSYVSGFKSQTLDTQAVVGWNGPGPFKLVNNYLEAAGENVMFGGGEASIPKLVPSDIEIRQNHFKKPLSWRPGDPSYAGTAWLVKNHLEFKNGQRALIEGNLFEDHWAGGQSGFFLILTPRGESGHNPWATTSDITFQYNLVRRTTAGIALSGTDGVVAQRARRVAIQNNVFEDLGLYVVPGASNGIFMTVSNGITDLAVEHNTVFNTYTVLYLVGLPSGPMTGFVFRNNVLRGGGYGIVGDGVGNGVRALDSYAPGWTFEGNVIVGPWPNQVGLNPPPIMLPPQFPQQNVFPTSFDDLGFVNRAGGDYHLGATSRYRRAGTGGREPGADITEVSSRRMDRGRAAPSAP